MKPGDEVRFRDDATSEGKSVAELYRNLTWRLVSIGGERVELESVYGGTNLKMFTLVHKLRPARPEEKSS